MTKIQLVSNLVNFGIDQRGMMSRVRKTHKFGQRIFLPFARAEKSERAKKKFPPTEKSVFRRFRHCRIIIFRPIWYHSKGLSKRYIVRKIQLWLSIIIGTYERKNNFRIAEK